MLSLRGIVGAPFAWARGIATWTATSVLGTMGYQVLDPGRKILSPGMKRSAAYTANELATSLPQLRSMSRRAYRDDPMARAAVEGLTAQVVGTGIALEPDHGDDVVNDRLRTVWNDFIAGCDVTGTRSLYELQTLGVRDVATSGEIVWRLVVLPERAAAGKVPLCVMPLDSEWLACDVPSPPSGGVTMVAGIELDRWGRPLAYHLRNPASQMSSDLVRVPAVEIIHEYEHTRALQNRGEPWLAPTLERIAQAGDLIAAELQSAITCAGIGIVIKSTGGVPVDTTRRGTTEDPAVSVGIGAAVRLYPDEDVTAFSHNRPGQQIEAFRSTLQGDIAASMRIPKRWLSKDYSGENFSASRMGNLDTDRLLSPVREWFGRATAGNLYLRALPYLCVIAGVPMPKRIAFRLLPDKCPYIDPYKEVQGSAAAITAGLSTWEAEIAKTGGDYRQVWAQLAKERAEAKSLGLVLDLSGTNAPAPDSTVSEKPEEKPQTETITDAEGRTIMTVRRE